MIRIPFPKFNLGAVDKLDVIAEWRAMLSVQAKFNGRTP